jgi:hypothetical protein
VRSTSASRTGSSSSSRSRSRNPRPVPKSAHTLCLGADGRFAVAASYRVAGAAAEPARARPITTDTGALWYFDEDNLELVVKVLDACRCSGATGSSPPG